MTTLIEWDSGPLPATNGASVTLDTEDGIPAPPGIAIAQEPSSVAWAHWNIDPAPELAVRLYARLPDAWAGSAWSICNLLPDPGTIAAGATLAGGGNPGQVRLTRAGINTVAQSGGGMVDLEGEHRIELRYDASESSCRMGVFPLASDTPIWDSAWQSHGDYEATIARITVGRTAAAPTVAPFLVSAILVTDDASDWIGRHPADTDGDPSGFAWHVWDGQDLIPATLDIVQ